MAFLVSVSAYSQSKSTNIVGAGNFLIQEVCDNVSPGKYITVYQVINAGTLKPFQYRDALWNIYTPISIVDSGCVSSSSAFNYDKETVCYSNGTDTLSGWLFSFVKDSTLVNSYITDLNLNKVNGTVIDPSFCEGCKITTTTDTIYGDTVVYNLLQYQAYQLDTLLRIVDTSNIDYNPLLFTSEKVCYYKEPFGYNQGVEYTVFNSDGTFKEFILLNLANTVVTTPYSKVNDLYCNPIINTTKNKVCLTDGVTIQEGFIVVHYGHTDGDLLPSSTSTPFFEDLNGNALFGQTVLDDSECSGASQYNDNEHFEINGAGSLTFAGGAYHSISYVVISGDVNVTVDGTPITNIPTGYNAYFVASAYLANDIVITAQSGDRVIITTVK